MAAPANLSFETAGVGAGQAQSWTMDTRATYEELAAYGTPAQPSESFEQGWSDNEDALVAFVDANVQRAIYDFSPGPPKNTENFERYWSHNESFAKTMDGVSVDLADYHPGGGTKLVEDLEDGWGNVPLVQVEADLASPFSLVDFDPGGGVKLVEDFESDWNNVGAVFYGFAAYNYAGPTTHAYENFEDVSWPAMLTI